MAKNQNTFVIACASAFKHEVTNRPIALQKMAHPENVSSEGCFILRRQTGSLGPLFHESTRCRAGIVTKRLSAKIPTVGREAAAWFRATTFYGRYRGCRAMVYLQTGLASFVTQNATGNTRGIPSANVTGVKLRCSPLNKCERCAGYHFSVPSKTGLLKRIRET